MKKIVLLMIIGILISSFYNLNVEIILAAPSSNYYVANDGDNSNDGKTPETAWRTIGKVNTELNGGVNQGDDIYFKRGDNFSGTKLQLKLGGTSSNPMIIGAYGTGAKPILGGNVSNGIAMQHSNTGNYTLENLNVSHCVYEGSRIHGIYFYGANPSSNLIFRNIEGQGSLSGIIIAGVTNYFIENCHFKNMGMSGIIIYGSGSNHATNGRIWNCTSHDNDKDGIAFHFANQETNYIGPNHWVKNCTLWNLGESGIDVSFGTTPDASLYVEDTEAYNCSLFGFGGAHHTINITYNNVHAHDNFYDIMFIDGTGNIIVRNSVFQNWTNGRGGYQSYGNADDDMTHNITFYNNDIICDGEAYPFRLNDGVVNGSRYQENLTFKNNIIYSTGYSTPGSIVQITTSLDNINNNNWSYNSWWRGDGDDDSTHWGIDGVGYNFTEWNSFSQVSNELWQDPKIYNPNASLFNLTSNSPCIDAGDWLTTTNGGGTGATITLHESGYFFDGYDISGLSGDDIFIGDDTNLEVTAVDYTAETITVNRSITWLDGDTVSLSEYNGSAPDIGAREFVSNGPNTIPPEITNIIRTTSDPLDTDVSFGWINITATVTGNSEVNTVMINVSCFNGSSFNVSMNAIGSNTYYYNTSTIFSNHGDFNYFIWANDTNGNQSTSTVYDFSMPPNWDINKDRQCTVLDLILISNHYDETGQNGWIREDVDNNGIVQMLDFVLVSEHYYETW